MKPPKDEDGVLTFNELEIVMKCLGQRPSGQISHFHLFFYKVKVKTLNSR